MEVDFHFRLLLVSPYFVDIVWQ